MINYLLEMFICQALFLGLYQLFKSEPYFRINRIYLLGALLISLILPLITLSQVIPIKISQSYFEWLQPVEIGTSTPNKITFSEIKKIENDSSFQWNLYYLLYSFGILLYVIWFIKRNRKTFQYLNLNSFDFYKSKPVVQIPKSDLAFSFFNRIYIGSQIPNSQYQLILEHEYQHLKQKHSWDIIIIEIIQCLLWFNPLIYIFKNYIRQLHEFEADKSVSISYSKINYINTLLNQNFGTQNVSFINPFFHNSNLKKRIKMLQRVQSSTLKKFKYLLIIPVMLIAVTISCTQDEIIEPEMTEEELKELKLDFIEDFFSEKPSIFKRLKNKPDLKSLLNQYDLEIKDNYSRLEKNAIGTILTFSTMIVKSDEDYYNQLIEEINSTESLKSIFEEYQNRLEENTITRTEIEEIDENTSIPFALIDKPPHPQNCDGLSNEELKKCTNEFINSHVNQNFNTGKFSDLEPKRYRVSVQFKIDNTGNVADIKTRGPSLELENEARRVIESLPQFVPGEQDGQAINVLYGLPINFVVAE